MRTGRTLLLWVMLALSPASALAQLPANAAHSGDQGKPINIEAQQGIEWQQDNRVYIARGNVKATRGGSTLYADTLYAFYRPTPEATAAAAKAVKDAKATPTAAKSGNGGADPLQEGATEVYRIEAHGNVRLATTTQTVYGDDMVYDIDKAVAVIKGKSLKLVTPTDTVTARDAFEWYDKDQLAVARGDAVAIRKDRDVRGDTLSAILEKPPGKPSHISKINAIGHVQVASADQMARGDKGIYNLDTGIATLTGNVSLNHGDTVSRGDCTVVDMNKNIGHVLASGSPGCAAASIKEQVKVMVVPHQQGPRGKPARAPLATPGSPASPPTTPPP